MIFGKRKFLQTLAVLVVLGSIFLAPMLAFAQGGVPLGTPWTLPQKVLGYDDNALPPWLIADQNNMVHAFNSVNTGNQRVVIEYSQWTRANGWTTPNDILVSPEKLQARIGGVFLDKAGVVHLTFFGGDDLGASIYYSNAPLAEAGRASAWSEASLVGEHAIAPTTLAMAGDADGNLFIIYSGNRDGVGLYSVNSTDGGKTWSEPSVVYLATDEVHWPSALRVITDDQDRVHAVWTMVNTSGNGDAVYYARLDADHKGWSDPVILAEKNAGDYEADWGSIVNYKGELIVVYDDGSPATRWMRRSSDGGQTWSDPVLPFNFVGEYGHASFVIDSANNLHMLLGNRTQDAIHGMWHAVWLGDHWSDLEPVVSGPRIIDGPLSGRFDPTKPQAVISQGNVLLVTWATDPGAGPNGIWSSYTVLNTPALPAVGLTTPTPEPTTTAFLAFERLQTPAARPDLIFQGNKTPPSAPIQSPFLGIIAAAIPAALLIIVVIALFRLRSNTHHREEI